MYFMYKVPLTKVALYVTRHLKIGITKKQEKLASEMLNNRNKKKTNVWSYQEQKCVLPSDPVGEGEGEGVGVVVGSCFDFVASERREKKIMP